jgi:hypothetical protein
VGCGDVGGSVGEDSKQSQCELNSDQAVPKARTGCPWGCFLENPKLMQMAKTAKTALIR